MQRTFSDVRDGYKYKIVQLRDGNWWLAENLRYEMPGSFPPDENPSESILATNPEYDWRKYGRLYTWEAAKEAPPAGWHLPSDREWKKMLKLYGGYYEGVAPDRQREKGANDLHLLIHDELDMEFGGFLNTANSLDVEGPPSRPYAYGYFYGEMAARFWSASKQVSLSVRGGIYYGFLSNGYAYRDSNNVEKAFSVRCIRD